MSLPDLIEIVPLSGPVRAEITVPGSKSITNRALILAALADGEVTLAGALWSEDTQVMVECLQKLGFSVTVKPDPDEFCNRTIIVNGLGGKIPNAGTPERPLELFVANAGTAARFLSALVCLGNGVYRLHGIPRMHERPQAALFKSLRQLGYRVHSENDNDRLPACIFGIESGRGASPSTTQTGTARGDITRLFPATRSCTISIEESSQFASALLMCAPFGGWQITVVGENAEESPYVAMTSKLIRAFPKSGGSFQIEPDCSSGSYFLAAGKLIGNPVSLEYSEQFGTKVHTEQLDPIKVADWPRSGWQMDEHFVEFITFQTVFSRVSEGESSGLPMSKQQIRELAKEHSKRFDHPEISRKLDIGDSIMTAIVITPLVSSLVTQESPTKFTDLGRLRVQETERVVALRTELTKCGAKVIEEGDALTVYPSELHGAEIETYNDHRMAMCFAILGLKVPGIKLRNPACVKKTFPNFFQKVAAPPPRGLGATILDAKTGRVLSHEELFAE